MTTLRMQALCGPLFPAIIQNNQDLIIYNINSIYFYYYFRCLLVLLYDYIQNSD